MDDDSVSLDRQPEEVGPEQGAHQQLEQQLLLAVRQRFGPSAKIHPTHALHQTGAVLWCGCCGGYAETLLCSLAQPCHPPTKKGTCNLGRLARGLHPRSGQPILEGQGSQGDIELEPPPPPPPVPHQHHHRHRTGRRRGGTGGVPV